MKRRILSILCVLCLVVAMLPPVTASAAAPSTLTVGGTTITSSGYWTTNADGTLTPDGASADNYNVYYDGNGTLTLKDATINGTDTTGHVGAGIYAEGDLTIVLEGSSTVTGVQDPNGDSQSIRVEGNLTIQGGGSLTAQGAETSSGSSYGIFVIGSFTQQGGSVTASGGNINGNYTSTGLYVYGSTVTVQGGTLTATGGTTGSGSYGISANGSVTVSDATVTATGGTGKYSYGLYVSSNSPSVTLSDSGSLTARSGSATSKASGIYFQNPFGSTGSVTVGNGSTLLTNSVIRQDMYNTQNPLAPTGDGSWLIYGQSNQTSAVGGNYTLKENITIPEDVTLTIPAGGTLTVPTGITLTVNGTLNIANQSSLTGSGTLNGSGNFYLTNPEPVISGDTELTYDGTDHFTDFSLTAPSGTVTVMGKEFAISDDATTEGWSLVEQEIKDAGTYTLTAKNSDGSRTVTKEITVSKATSSISINNTYNPGKTYDGTALANPTESELTLTGAGYNDVTFIWYKGSVDKGNKLDSAPADAGTYYLVASIPESDNTSGVSVTSEAITISPAEISITGATLKTKTYDGTTAATVESVTFSGTTQPAETDYTVTAIYNDADANVSQSGTVTVTLTSGNFTFAENQDEATYASATGTINKLPVVLEWSTPTEFTYDGQEKTVTAKITNVVGDDDVTLTYTDNSKTNKGTYTATVTLTGTDAGNYTLDGVENASLTWRIVGVSIAGAEVSIDPATATYNGSEQAPTVTVTLDDKELDGDTDYEVSYDPAEVKNAGTYTVTVTGTGNYEGTATATFTIQKADPNIGDVTYSGGDLYDSTALDSITLNRSNTTVPGTLKLDAGQTLRADVSSYKWTFTPDDADNYETVTGTVQLIVLADTLESVSVKSGPSKAEYVYGDFFDKTGLVLEATYESGNKKEISADEITVETTGPLTCDMEEVTVSYQGMECQVPVTVNKATYSGQTTVTGTIWANTASEVQLPQPPDGATFGNPVYSVDSDTVVRVEITGNTLAYEGGTGITKGQEYEITVPVNGGTNYNDYDITVTLIGTDKKVPTGAPTLSTTTITYGQGLSTITLSGSMQDGAETVTGTFAWADPDETPNAGSYEARWTFTPDNGDLYEPGSGTVTITVNKATPRGTPKYTAITTSGKTLADAGLTTEGGTFSVPGTVAWELDDTTQVQANTAYTWKFTPDDSDNYNSISGSVTLYTVSSGGGGGGGSSSSNITTETTKNPDGSTTTTVTNKNTGTVTETTTWPDGSKEIIETKKDGTVTTTTTDTAGNQTQVVQNTDGSSETTVSNKDGSGSVTLVDVDGNIISQATLSESAVAAAQAAGEAVALPMPEVPVTTDRETAPTVTVNLPVGGSVKVEIPVEDVTTSTVAVIVKANGTEEVIKTSLTTETGVAVTLSDGDTVKVVDNSKTFDDVPGNYWGAEAVAFASSRELFAGTSATTFAPDTAMTRAMIVTVLARFEGVDTTTGSTWYEAGRQWAMQNGVSDGTNIDASLTREQLATMLWRYAGSPSVSDNLSGYTDADTVSSYAQQAMAWCVEHGIIGGTTTTTLSPQGPATRAQVATILMRFIEGNQ